MTRNKFWFLAIAIGFILWDSGLLAQPYRVEISLEGGPNFAKSLAIEERGISLPSEVTMLGSAAVQYNLSRFFALRLGVALERKGFSVAAVDLNGVKIPDLKRSTQFDYLVFPLLWRMGIGKRIRVFVNVGPHVAYLNGIIDKEGRKKTVDKQLSFLSNWDRIDLGLSSGIGLIIPVRKRLAVSAEFRNNRSFLNPVSTQNFSASYRHFSNNVSLGITYRFIKTIKLPIPGLPGL